jgi:hypothetical protein
VGLQSAGVIMAWLARLTRGTLAEAGCQWLFLAMLALVGLATGAAMLVGPE